VLLAGPAGSLFALGPATRCIDLWGSAKVLKVVLVPTASFGAVIGLANTALQLSLILFLWGLLQGSLDISANAQAAAIESKSHRSVFSSMHGFWSLGALCGAGIGTMVVATGLTISSEYLMLGLLGCAAVVPLSSPLLQGDIGKSARFRGSKPGRGGMAVLIVLGLIAFNTALAEGAVADWSAVYLRDVLAVSPARAGLAFGAYSLGTLVGRAVGDPLVNRLGRVRAIQLGSGISSTALTCGLAIPQPISAITGFAGLGLGLGCVLPAVYGMSSRTTSSLALVTLFGWMGFVAGPPVIGLLADTLGLSKALWVVVGTSAATALLVGVAGQLSRDRPGS